MGDAASPSPSQKKHQASMLSLKTANLLLGAAIVTCAAFGAPTLAEWLLFPPGPFDPADVPPPPDYSSPASWAASPLHKETKDRAWWTPGSIGGPIPRNDTEFDVFWVHPTTYFMGRWNAAIDTFSSNLVTTITTAEHAGVFNGACRVFAPRYRQLSQGVQDRYSVPEQTEALDVAFADVWAAFRYFLEHTEGRPFFIGAYSQGTLHSMRLLQRWLPAAPANEGARLVAAFLIGNTVPEPDMEGVLPVCKSARQTHCYVSYNTVLRGDDAGSRHWRKKGPPTCVNPLTWSSDELHAESGRHLGAIPLVASVSYPVRWLSYPLIGYARFDGPDVGLLSAQCQDGILYVSDPASHPTAGHRYRFNPGTAMHSLDLHLFWLNLRANVHERAEAFRTRWEAPHDEESLA